MTQMAGEQLTIITVTHNSGAVIGKLLESLPVRFPLVIVDNASRDNTLNLVESIRPDAKIIRNAVGMGYGNGMNTGLREISTEFALLANPDTILSGQAIDVMISTATTYPDSGIIGPEILSPANRIEPSHDVELHKRKVWGAALEGFNPVGPACVESLSGAVMLVRMQSMEDINFFDPSFFLYFEDEDLCKKMRSNGHVLIYEPGARVTHVGGGSVPATAGYSWEKFWHMSWSRLYYERKYYGNAAALYLALCDVPKFAFKALGYCLILNMSKARRDAARCIGMLAGVLGIPAVPRVVQKMIQQGQ